MGDHQLGAAGDGDGLRRDPAGPEHRYLPRRGSRPRRRNPARRRPSMPIAAGSPTWTGAPWRSGKREQIRSPAPPAPASSAASTPPSARRSGPPAGTRRSVRYIGTLHALLDVPHREPRVQQRVLERERAADQERDEVVAPLARGRRWPRSTSSPFAPDAVARQVGAEVGAGRDVGRLGRARVADLQHRARLRVAPQNRRKSNASASGRTTRLACVNAGARPAVGPVQSPRRIAARTSARASMAPDHRTVSTPSMPAARWASTSRRRSRTRPA